MASDVIVPEVGELGMDVTFVRWLKSPGDDVAVGEPLFELDTEKSVMVVEAYAAGVLADLSAIEGDTVAPRQVIGRIVVPDEPDVAVKTPTPAAAAATSAAAAATSAAAAATSAATSSQADPVEGTGRQRPGISPRGRRVASDLGVDIDSVAGTGPDGLITETDVRAAALAAERRVQAPRERARLAVAELTARSWRTVPHFYLQVEADVEQGLALAKPTALICACVARALARHPECNLAWAGDVPVPRERVDLGLLVDAPSGLLIAVIGEAQLLDLPGMADAVSGAAARARSGKLAAADMGARSLTVSNLGMYTVDRFSAVIPVPDILTLAVGRTRTVPRWNGAAFIPRRVVELTLSVDHRALDGAAAARFLTTLAGMLADPAAAGL